MRLCFGVVGGVWNGFSPERICFALGFQAPFLVLEVVAVEAWYTTALDIEEVLFCAADSDVHLFVADVIKSHDTVDRGILDRVLSSLGLPSWFRHAYFDYHAHVWLRFKLTSGLGLPWTRDGAFLRVAP